MQKKHSFSNFNNICNALDQKKHCAALFVDLIRAFDCVHRGLLLNRLKDIDISDLVCQWFRNYLPDRTQCAAANGHQSDFMRVSNGVPQGSILAPVLFADFINDIRRNLNSAKNASFSKMAQSFIHSPLKLSASSSLHLQSSLT